jgi:hypothetical protein
MSNNNNTLKMLVFIALATIVAGAVAAISLSEQASAQAFRPPQANCHDILPGGGEAISECASAGTPRGPPGP